MVQDTSKQAYKDIVHELGDRQKRVLELFTHRGIAMTNNEIADILKWAINCVTPRVFELRCQNKLIERGKRRCRITGRTGKIWGLPAMRTDLFEGGK